MDTEIIKVVGALAASFPHAKISDETVDVYVDMLQDIPIEILRTAAKQCIAESEFFPTIAKIRDKATALVVPARTTPADAWGEVMTAMKQVGFYGQPRFDDPIIERIVFAMDWPALCSSENTIADRAHFMKMYEQMAERENAETRLLPGTVAMRAQIAGQHERRQIQESSTNAAIQRRGPHRV